MGKASRWLRALLGTKKNSDSSPGSAGSESRSGKGNKKWGFAHHSNGSGGLSSVNASKSATITSPYAEGIDANKHAIAVAAATAAVAEAALAAAQAAAEVVRLTSGGGRPRIGGGYDRRRDLAAVKIQSAFRAYLARRALRALKGLVKLQAIVRGRIVRKQSTDMLRRMQALARIQARACANRALITDSAYSRSKSAQYNYHGSAMPKKRDQQHGLYSNKPDGSILKRVGSKLNTNENIGLDRNLGSSWLDHWMEESSLKTGLVDDEKSDKILEIDNWKPPINPNRRNDGLNLPTFDSNLRHQLKPRNPNHNLSFGSLKSPNVRLEAEQAGRWVNESSPHAHSATSRPGSSGGRRGPFTPARSECSRSLFGEYVGHPNYMANTESYRAKLRSHSAPRQRPGSARRFQYGPWDLDTVSERGVPISHANFRA